MTYFANVLNNKPIYLAHPYSHISDTVREHRYMSVTMIAAELVQSGLLVYSPITHSHPMAKMASLPMDWAFWEKYDRAFLEMCSELWVVAADGWQDSKGMAAEIQIAKELKLKIRYWKVYDGNKLREISEEQATQR